MVRLILERLECARSSDRLTLRKECFYGVKLASQVHDGR